MFVKMDRAIELVLELARESIISEQEASQDHEVLNPIRLEQIAACDTLEDFFTNNPQHISEDEGEAS